MGHLVCNISTFTAINCYRRKFAIALHLKLLMSITSLMFPAHKLKLDYLPVYMGMKNLSSQLGLITILPSTASSPSLSGFIPYTHPLSPRAKSNYGFRDDVTLISSGDSFNWKTFVHRFNFSEGGPAQPPFRFRKRNFVYYFAVPRAH